MTDIEMTGGSNHDQVGAGNARAAGHLFHGGKDPFHLPSTVANNVIAGLTVACFPQVVGFWKTLAEVAEPACCNLQRGNGSCKVRQFTSLPAEGSGSIDFGNQMV